MEKLTVLYINNDWNNLCGSSLSLIDMLNSLGDTVHPIILSGKDGPANQQLQAMGYETIVCPFYKLYAPSNILSYILHLPQLLWSYYRTDRDCIKYVSQQLKGRKIDIVHSNSSIFTIGYYIAKAMGVPHVWHVREFLDIDLHVLLGKNRLKRLFRLADRVICISNPIKEYWCNNAKNSIVIGDAVRKKQDAIFDRNKEKYILSCSSQLSDYKGSAFIARAFARSGIFKQGYKLYMIGEYTSDYKEKIATILNEDNVPLASVMLLGFQDNVKEYFVKASAFVMASRNEGLGRVCIEAMFYGCPVIAKNVGGTSDFIIDKKTGFIYDSLDSCARLIREVSVNEQCKVVEAAQRIVIENYSQEKFGSKIKEVYDSVYLSSINHEKRKYLR